MYYHVTFKDLLPSILQNGLRGRTAVQRSSSAMVVVPKKVLGFLSAVGTPEGYYLGKDSKTVHACYQEDLLQVARAIKARSPFRKLAVVRIESTPLMEVTSEMGGPITDIIFNGDILIPVELDENLTRLVQQISVWAGLRKWWDLLLTMPRGINVYLQAKAEINELEVFASCDELGEEDYDEDEEFFLGIA